MLGFHEVIKTLWNVEKIATIEALSVSKEEGLTALAKQREKIMKMTREDAIVQLIRDNNLDGREVVIRSVAVNEILNIA